MNCTAKRTNGEKCKAPAITGTNVCRVHGGSAPQVIAAAHRRILRAADPIAARMIEIALSKRTKVTDAITIGRDLLTRAGALAPAENAGAGESQVLWDEFIQIHRRRVGQRDDEADPGV